MRTINGPDGKVIEVESGPDNLGRYSYTMTWPVEWHPYCPRCGRNVNDHINPSSVCRACGTETKGLRRGQCFHAPLPNWTAEGKEKCADSS